MNRRLATAALALLLALASIGVCARGVQACAAMGAAVKDCCHKGVTLAAADCCCPAKAASTSDLPSGAPGSAITAMQHAATGASVLPPAWLVSSHSGVAPEWRALAPPDTPVGLHISLLL